MEEQKELLREFLKSVQKHRSEFKKNMNKLESSQARIMVDFHISNLTYISALASILIEIVEEIDKK